MSSMICQQQLKWKVSSCHFRYSSCLFPSTSLLTVSAVALGLLAVPSVLHFMPSVTSAPRTLTSITCRSQQNQPAASTTQLIVASRQPAFRLYRSKLASVCRKKTCLPSFAEYCPRWRHRVTFQTLIYKVRNYGSSVHIRFISYNFKQQLLLLYYYFSILKFCFRESAKRVVFTKQKLLHTI
jgi:hypothetical protein